MKKSHALEATESRLQSELSTYQARLRIKEDEMKRLGNEISGLRSEREKMSGENEKMTEELEVRKKELDGQRKEWEGAVQRLQECHRIIMLRNVGTLEAERCERMRVQEEVRKEKVERMRAEFESARLRGEVVELEAKVDEKDEVLDGVKDRYMEEVGAMIARVQELEVECKNWREEAATYWGDKEIFEVCGSHTCLFHHAVLSAGRHTVHCWHYIDHIHCTTTGRTI